MIKPTGSNTIGSSCTVRAEAAMHEQLDRAQREPTDTTWADSQLFHFAWRGCGPPWFDDVTGEELDVEEVKKARSVEMKFIKGKGV